MSIDSRLMVRCATYDKQQPHFYSRGSGCLSCACEWQLIHLIELYHRDIHTWMIQIGSRRWNAATREIHKRLVGLLCPRQCLLFIRARDFIKAATRVHFYICLASLCASHLLTASYSHRLRDHVYVIGVRENGPFVMAHQAAQT